MRPYTIPNPPPQLLLQSAGAYQQNTGFQQLPYVSYTGVPVSNTYAANTLLNT